ncbi:MAG: beta-lactamase family protein [Caulobacteraceae bacterium]|nr:beta-lactamase family protein [Caulobacteraceae bacterium]
MQLQTALNRIVASEHRHPDVHEIALGVMEGERFIHACRGEWQGGPVGPETPFLIASASKLFITAMVFQLADEGRLTLDDPVRRFFPGELDGLHVWKGVDVTGQITLRHLLCHTSGLPDYFEGRRRDGASLAADLFAGRDGAYGLAEVLGWARDGMRPAFAPGTGMRALYSDTNFYLLAELVARLDGDSLDAALARRITGPLGLTRTAFFKPGAEVLPLRLGGRVIEAPQALASMPGDGGAVSCLADLARFTRAFFAGELFEKGRLADLPPWRRVFFPLTAGTGVLRFAVPGWLPPFRPGMAFVGHSGISGTIAFALPDHKRIIVGTVNQLQDRSRPYRMMMKAALAWSRIG